MEGGIMADMPRYTLETGASKKRKREAEVEYWNSLNGPVVIKKAEVKKEEGNASVPFYQSLPMQM